MWPASTPTFACEIRQERLLKQAEPPSDRNEMTVYLRTFAIFFDFMFWFLLQLQNTLIGVIKYKGFLLQYF